jgi:hypothetical protein
MPSTADTYRDAAKEHLARAQELFSSEQHFLSHYLSGLAVECHLRAYLRRRTDEFDARHDLQELAKQSGFFDIVPSGRANDFSAKFSTLNLRWRSNQRYYSEREFLDYMTTIKAEFHTKGDRWKNLSRAVLNLAYDVINQGEAKWDSR